MDRMQPPLGASEATLVAGVAALERVASPAERSYWLITAGLMEAALIRAGHYADAGEFRLAGDLLFTPRRIHIYRRGRRRPEIKHRHGRLTDQLGLNRLNAPERARSAAADTVVHTVSDALIPTLNRRLAASRRFRQWYLNDVDTRMAQIAATIGFLSAWSIAGPETLIARLRQAPPKDSDLADARLCRFDTRLYHRIGHELRLIAHQPGYRSTVLR